MMKLPATTYRSVLGALLGISLVASGAALADSVALSNETGQAGETVTVTFTYTGDGSQFALQAEAVIANPAAFSNIDASELCSGSTANTTSCDFDGTDTLQFLASNGSNDPLESFTGTFDLTIAAEAPLGVIDISWDETTTFTPTTGTDGSVEVVSGPQSELVLTPDPLAFNTVDLGDMPVTESFTLSNEGEASASISDVSLAGPDTEFTIASDSCTGTLAAGADCTITIQFDADANGSYSNAINIDSDANVNPTPSADITGSADSVASLSVTPDFGPVPLGTVLKGTAGTASGTLSNSGSADGDFSCTLTGDSEISTDPSPLSGTVPAGGSVGFSISCAVPDTAEDGDSYSAVLECTGDNDFGGTHEISCDATEFEAVPVPTMTNWSVALFALMMLIVGGISIRFFRT